MNYPLISEYVEAIKAAEDNFDQLKHLRPVLGEDGEPVMSSGGFAVVFKMKDEQTGKLHAVKCFLKEQEGRAEAYRQIAEELEFVSSTFLTPIKYLDKELFVDSGNTEDSEFPVLLMDWVEGQTLDKYIREHIDDQYELSLLAYQFSRLAMWLMPQPFAHGDLKPDNILVKEDGTLVLVDYDGMYVPAMKGQKARELGSPDFRHPGRTEEVFDDHIDDFSLASILLSLKAIALQPSLLEEYGASDRLLFSEKDYRNLSESGTLGALQPLMQDAELASLYSLYILALSQNNLSQVSFRLFNLSRPDRSQYEEENLSTEVTEDDLANAWTDEYGVKYTRNGKKVLGGSRKLEGLDYIIKDGVEVICDRAFQSYNLHSIKLPSTVKVIGIVAFANNGNMEYCNIPSSVRLIKHNNPWGGCFNIKKFDCESPCFTIKDGVLYSSDFSVAYGFIYWRPTICIDKQTKIVCANAFWSSWHEDKSFIKRIDLSHVEMIGHNAFFCCEGLTSLSIPNSVISIGKDAFGHCKGINAVTIPRSVTEICEGAFRLCSGLTSVIIPNGVTSIGAEAFDGCSLSSLIIPSSITCIGVKAFRCSSLESIVVEKGNSIYDSRDNCNAIIESASNTLIAGCKNTIIPNSVISIGPKAFSECDDLKTIEIPKNIVSIEQEAFAYCYCLKSVIIPNSVKSIGTEAFSFCEEMKAITFLGKIESVGDNSLPGYDEIIIVPLGTKGYYEKLFPEYVDKLVEKENPEELRTKVYDEDLVNSFTDEFGVMYDSLKKKLIKAEEKVYLYEYDVCIGTEIICDKAFYGCRSLTILTIPSSITDIGQSAFHKCKSLEQIVFLGSVLHISDHAFMQCDSLSQIVIPSGTIENYKKLLPNYVDLLFEDNYIADGFIPFEWTPVGDKYTLQEICDAGIFGFNYSDIKDEADIYEIEFADGSTKLRIILFLTDGHTYELKVGENVQNYYDEGDKVKVNLIYGQELHKVGQSSIIRYDVWNSEEEKKEYLAKRDAN